MNDISGGGNARFSPRSRLEPSPRFCKHFNIAYVLKSTVARARRARIEAGSNKVLQGVHSGSKSSGPVPKPEHFERHPSHRACSVMRVLQIGMNAGFM
jgi:hypothetical protein